MSLRHKVLKILLPLILLATGATLMVFLIANKKPPARKLQDNKGALVEVSTVSPEDRQVVVRGTGTVQPRREAKILPQVSGRVVWVSPHLVVGGFFTQGERLLELESVDYRLAAEKAKAALAKARYDLASAESQARVARAEWKRLSLDSGEEPNPLVLYQPQLDNARASVAAAEAGLEEAALNLERTRITAPFDCIVRSETVDEGQYVSPATSVADLAGTGSAEIVVPLPLEEFSWIDVPRQDSPETGSVATVILRSAGESQTRSGRVVRSLGEVDPIGRMARVAVAVDDPYDLAGNRRNGIRSLQFGMFVEVEIQGKRLPRVVALPRSALQDDSTVWVADGDDLLRIRPVTVARREQDVVLVSGGLDKGERVVLTLLSGAADGMKLRPRGPSPEVRP